MTATDVFVLEQNREPSSNTQESHDLKTIVLASMGGTLIEWYDFFVYGTLATTLAPKFYKSNTPDGALIIWLSTWAVGFIARPFGAIVFGHLGDILGRKFNFVLTLTLMGLCSFLVGCLPTYDSIGVAAGYILIVLRLLQGLALGGEYGAAAIYIAEHAPMDKRGYYTSYIQSTPSFGMMLSLLITIICRVGMGVDQFNSWGWRIPFWFSIFLVGASLYIRLKLSESPMFAKAKENGHHSKNPLLDSFGKWENLKTILIAFFGCCIGVGVTFYTPSFYGLYFLQNNLKYDTLTAWGVVCVAEALATPFFFFFGTISDRFGRKIIMLAGLVLSVISWYPVFMGLHALGPYVDATVKPLVSSSSYNPYLSCFLIFIMVTFSAMAYGPMAAFMVELFPTSIRYTSLSVPYHIGTGVLGGATPLIAVSLTTLTGNWYAGLWYPIGTVGLCAICMLIFVPETFQVNIEELGGQHERKFLKEDSENSTITANE